MTGFSRQKMRHQALGRQGQNIVLHGFHALDIVLRLGLDHLGDAVHAMRCHPVLA